MTATRNCFGCTSCGKGEEIERILRTYRGVWETEDKPHELNKTSSLSKEIGVPKNMESFL